MNVTELREFWASRVTIGNFSQGYGIIAKPLTQLLMKQGFVWPLAAQQPFETLKIVISTTPASPLPNFHQPFTIEKDACANGIGAVLSQNGRVVAFVRKVQGMKNTTIYI